MAPSKRMTEAALSALQDPGFYCQDDSEVGEQALIPFEDIHTEAGFQFYEENFLGDQRICEVLRRSFGQAQLVGYRTFPPEPTRIFQFRRGGEKADCILVALLWPPNSEFVYYSNSLKHNMPAVDADNGLLRVPQAAANQAGCGKGVPITMKKGGLTIQDGRTLIKFLRGKPVAATFATDQFLEKWNWKRRVLETTEDMEQKLMASETEDLKLYVEFSRVPSTSPVRTIQS